MTSGFGYNTACQMWDIDIFHKVTFRKKMATVAEDCSGARKDWHATERIRSKGLTGDYNYFTADIING